MKMPIDELVRSVVARSQRSMELRNQIEALDYNHPLYQAIRKNLAGNGRGWEEEIVPMTTDRPIFV